MPALESENSIGTLSEGEQARLTKMAREDGKLFEMQVAEVPVTDVQLTV